MENKHTPGPWKAIKIGETYDIVSKGPWENAIQAELRSSKPSPVIGTGLRLRDDGTGSSIRNARLIAAAPELLEALKGLSDILHNHYGDDPDETPLIDKAFEAISKAEGKL